MLSRFSPLFREARYLLAEELCFGAAEPSGQLRHAAATEGVSLIGLDDLYGQGPGR